MKHDLYASLPRPADRPVAVRVGKDAARRVLRGHPWIFESAVEHVARDGAPGDLAVVYDARREQIAVGLYDPRSPVRVRVLYRGGARVIDGSFFQKRLEAAIARRAALAATDTDGYRVVHGENDGMPALVVDRYAGTLVVKLYSAAWIPRLAQVMPPLLSALTPERVVLRLARRVAEQEDGLAGLRDGALLLGAHSDATRFRENGFVFEIDPIKGQKTGFFLDQRDNRALVEERAAGLDVLNAFAYTGGFSLYAARGGAQRVASLDASAPALQAAVRNFAHNADIAAVRAALHELVCDDAFAALARLGAQRRRFGMVVIDPPSFTRKKDDVGRALASYARLCELGIGVLVEGGWLVMASCSSRVTRDAFRDAVTRAAREAGRPLDIQLETEHAVDHPITFREGAYLKCLFTRA